MTLLAEQIKSAALDIKLSEDEIPALEKPYVSHPVLGLF